MVIYIFFAGILALLVVLYLSFKILRKPKETPPRHADIGKPETIPPAPQPESASPAAPKPSAPAEASTPRPATATTQPTPAAKPSVVAAAVRPQAAPPAPAPFGAHVPQDSVLRRHYLAQAQLMAETVSGPSPADSVLRRHHRQLAQSRLAACLRDSTQMERLRADYAACRAVPQEKAEAPVDIQPAAPAAVEAPIVLTAVQPEAAPVAKRAIPMGAHVPQDSVLRRHYLAQARLMVETVSGPSPADSVLRRHHRQLAQSRLEACLGDPARMDQLRADYAACRAACAAQPTAAPAPQAAVATPAPALVAGTEALQRTVRIPEDSVLRRHFLNHVRHLLERTAPVRPTDSVLRRHYEHYIGSELRACLGDPARIERLLTGRTARQA